MARLLHIAPKKPLPINHGKKLWCKRAVEWISIEPEHVHNVDTKPFQPNLEQSWCKQQNGPPV
eukprot:scaffold44018_cov19-Tisochrysis_lutea.AAC.1